MERIKQYYKVCNIKPNSQREKPIIDQIDERVLDIVFTKKQVFMYIIKDTTGTSSRVTVKESVVGGKKRNTEKALVVC